MVSHGLLYSHMISYGLLRSLMVSHDLLRFLMVSHVLFMVSYVLLWSLMISYGLLFMVPYALCSMNKYNTFIDVLYNFVCQLLHMQKHRHGSKTHIITSIARSIHYGKLSRTRFSTSSNSSWRISG
jgi:hypothetical protein